FQSATEVSSHELAEAVTDPGTNGIGWYDEDNNGEIGDLTDQITTLNGFVVQDVVNKHDTVIGPSHSTARQNHHAGIPDRADNLAAQLSFLLRAIDAGPTALEATARQSLADDIFRD